MIVQQKWILWNRTTGRLLQIVKQVPANLGRTAVGVALVRANLWPEADMDDHIELEVVTESTHWALRKQMREENRESRRVREIKWWEIEESITEERA